MYEWELVCDYILIPTTLVNVEVLVNVEINGEPPGG